MLRKILCLTFLVFLCKSTVRSCRSSPSPPEPKPIKPVKPIPVPRLYHINPNDHGNITFIWDPIAEDKIDEGHPILGFKVKVWPEQRIKLFNFTNMNGEMKLNENYDNLRKSSLMDPETDVIVLTVGPDSISASINNTVIKHLVHYWAKVWAFTDLSDGPYSNALGFKLLGRFKDLNKHKLNGTISSSIPN